MSVNGLYALINGVFKNQGARVYHDANQAITNNTVTALAFNTERYDTDAIHDNVTNNSRLTCRTAGKYVIVGNFAFAANAVGDRLASIRLNGVTLLAYSFGLIEGTWDKAYPIVATIYKLGVGDYVELIAWQSSGGDLNVDVVANYSAEFMMQRIG